MMSSPPLSTLFEFHAKNNPYALIIGVYNEGDKFAKQLAALQPYRHMVDIIIADGRSTDGATTPEVLKDKVRTLLINQEKKRGLGIQYRSALSYALSQNYNATIMMDGNNKDGVEAIPQFIDKLNEGYDFIQGSRFMLGGCHKNTPVDRFLGIRFVFNPIMYLGSGFYSTDGMNGFKACSRAFLCDPRAQLFRDVFAVYNFQYYFNYIAPKLGLRVIEIPVSRVYPDDGSPYSKIPGLRGRIRILFELLSTVTGRYNP